MKQYENQLEEILDFSKFLLSDTKPSEWAESHRVMTTDVTPFPGPFKFKHTPYCKEILDCLSPDHPARVIAVKKGAQIGFSVGVIENGIGYIIAQQPGNILFLSGHQELSEEAMNTKIDQMIDSCGLRPSIKPNVRKKRNQRTGDTARSKEFPGGYLVAGSASNHKLLRQRSIRYGFIDDFDAAKKSSKESGNTRTLIQQRFAAYYDKMKLYYISTPEVLATSNIEPTFLLGDQRRYFVPCPCCGAYIALYWEIEFEGPDGKQRGGITWKLDGNGKLISESVGYICQLCGDFFNDSKKFEMNLVGEWRPTAEPSEVGYYSYHISSLYAPPGMYDWEYYVRQYLEACPPEGKIKEDLFKTFWNLCLGEPYEEKGRAIEANSVQKKIRNYKIDTIPETLSIKDGNGTVVMLTCACDLNGTEHDARLDYEITAWAESGSSYSIRHGSIGTFVPREKAKAIKEDRVHWTYEFGRQNCVWPDLEKILNTTFTTDTERPMRILLTGVDCGHYTNHAYSFIDRTPLTVIGVRGDKEGQYRKLNIDIPVFKPAKERPKLYMLDVNHVKDMISANIDLRWIPGTTEVQPPGFMNFPEPAEGLYLYPNYFQHYESEHRSVDLKDGEGVASRWIKKTTNLPNHFWDVCVYNYCLKEIWADMCLRAAKPPRKGNWYDFINYMREMKYL